MSDRHTFGQKDEIKSVVVGGGQCASVNLLLKQLLVQLLGALSQEGYVKLDLVAHDGTKIRAQAGSDTFRREGTLEKETAKAQQLVEELDRERQQAGERAGEPQQSQRQTEVIVQVPWRL